MKLVDYIEFKRISKTRVARDLKITRQYLYEILKGNMPPGRKLAQRIADWSKNAVTFSDLWK